MAESDDKKLHDELLSELAALRQQLAVHAAQDSRNIVDRRQSAVDLQQSQAAWATSETGRGKAEAAERSKDRFFAMLSHELRTPLSPVLMLATIRESDPATPEDVRADFATVRQNVELQLSLIDDLYDIAAIANGKLVMRCEAVKGHDLLRTVGEICKSDLQKKGLVFDWQLDARNDNLMADRGRLAQVFWNLIRNAVKFTPSGGTVTVRSRNESDGDFAVEVTDNGIGIDANAIASIFDAFDQGHAGTTAEFGGLGLGLAISKAVVDMHGGKIRVSSGGIGAGSVFTVTVPSTVVPPKNAARSDAASIKTKPLRILVVDDHEDTANVMARLLKLDGHAVRVANCATDALELAAANPFDLLISDIGLPDQSGHELMRQLHAQYGLTGVALTGYGRDEDVEKSRESGFLGHLTKPVSLSQLHALIRELTPAQ